MKIIIVQGMTCLGKSTLCNRFEKDINNCKVFSLDKYKENMWDKFGFDSCKQREHQSLLAKELFYSDIDDVIRGNAYEYIFLDYAFTEKYWNELMENLNRWGVPVKTVYLKTLDLDKHREIWEERSRNFAVRHPGHGATHYHDGVGTEYVNSYYTKIYYNMPVTNKTLEVLVSFDPYHINISYEQLLDFIKK